MQDVKQTTVSVLSVEETNDEILIVTSVKPTTVTDDGEESTIEDHTYIIYMVCFKAQQRLLASTKKTYFVEVTVSKVLILERK